MSYGDGVVGAPPRATPPWRDFGKECAADAVGMDEGALDRLQAMFQGWVAGGRMNSAAALVARRGSVAWCGGCGEQNPGKAVQADTIYHVYSMTKPVTAVAILMLMEEGRLLLNMPLHRFLGKSWHKKNMKVCVGGTKDEPILEPCKRSITLQHLLTHTAGLSYGFVGTEMLHPVCGMYQDKLMKIQTFEETEDEQHFSTLEQALETIASLPLCFQPGDRWHYSLAFDILGRVVEVVSGESFGAFLQRRIFEPLGMYDTSFEVPGEKEHRLATLWRASLRTGALKPVGMSSSVLSSGGGGGLKSTMTDYLRFAQCMLNGGVGQNGARILSRRTMEWMVSNHLPSGADIQSMSLPGFIFAPGLGQGLGVSVKVDPIRSISNTGLGTFSWGGMASTAFWCDPEEDVVVVFMTQVIGLDEIKLPLTLRLATMVSGAIVDGRPRPLGVLAGVASARSKL